jgi:hypothetical protein
LIAFGRKLLKSANGKKHGQVVKRVPQVCSPRLAQIVESQSARLSGGLYDVSAIPEHLRRPKRPEFNRNHDAIRQRRGFEKSEAGLGLLIPAKEGSIAESMGRNGESSGKFAGESAGVSPSAADGTSPLLKTKTKAF